MIVQKCQCSANQKQSNSCCLYSLLPGKRQQHGSIELEVWGWFKLMKPTHGLIYISLAMASTRCQPPLDCFEKHVRTNARYLAVRFMATNVKGPGPLADSDRLWSDASAFRAAMPVYQAHPTGSQCLAPHISAATVTTVVHHAMIMALNVSTKQNAYL